MRCAKVMNRSTERAACRTSSILKVWIIMRQEIWTILALLACSVVLLHVFSLDDILDTSPFLEGIGEMSQRNWSSVYSDLSFRNALGFSSDFREKLKKDFERFSVDPLPISCGMKNPVDDCWLMNVSSRLQNPFPDRFFRELGPGHLRFSSFEPHIGLSPSEEASHFFQKAGVSPNTRVFLFTFGYRGSWAINVDRVVAEAVGTGIFSGIFWFKDFPDFIRRDPKKTWKKFQKSGLKAAGFGFWKPVLAQWIMEKSSKVQDGDILVYSDAGSSVGGRMSSFKKKAKKLPICDRCLRETNDIPQDLGSGIERGGGHKDKKDLGFTWRRNVEEKELRNARPKKGECVSPPDVGWLDILRLLDSFDAVGVGSLCKGAPERKLTKADLLQGKMGFEHSDAEAVLGQVAGGYQIYRVNSYSRRLVALWAELMEDWSLSSTDPSHIHNFQGEEEVRNNTETPKKGPGFRQHKMDQSVWSMLLKSFIFKRGNFYESLLKKEREESMANPALRPSAPIDSIRVGVIPDLAYPIRELGQQPLASTRGAPKYLQDFTDIYKNTIYEGGKLSLSRRGFLELPGRTSSPREHFDKLAELCGKMVLCVPEGSGVNEPDKRDDVKNLVFKMRN